MADMLDSAYNNPLEVFNNDISVQDQIKNVTDVVKNRIFYLAMKGVSSSDIGVTLDLQTYTIEEILKEVVQPLVLVKIGKEALSKKKVSAEVVDKDTGEVKVPAVYEDRKITYKDLQLICRTGRVETKADQADLVDRVRAKSLRELEKKLDTRAIHSTRDLLGVLKTIGVGETGGNYAPGHDIGHRDSAGTNVNINTGNQVIGGSGAPAGIQVLFDKDKMGNSTPLVNNNKEVIGIKSTEVNEDGDEIETIQELGNISRKGLEELAFKKDQKDEKDVLSKQRGLGKASEADADMDENEPPPATQSSEIDDYLASQLG